MTSLHRAFCATLLWATRLELALALAAPSRNRAHIEALQRDVSDYESALIRMDMVL